MANKNETTTTFNADISRLKSAFQEASRQIRLANSEFKAAASGMDDWGNSADGISAKLTQLDKVLSSQKEQLKSLEEQYRLVAREQGENSAGAQNLLIRINNQRAAVSDTENQIKSYNARLSDMQSGSDRTGSAADKLKESIQKQEQELSSLKDEYADTVLEQDRESEAARELAAKIDSLSGELNENRNKLSEAESAADEFDNTLNDIDENADKASNGFTVMKGALADLVSKGVQAAIGAFKELAGSVKESYDEYHEGTNNIIKATGASGNAAKELEKSYKNAAKSVRGDLGSLGSTLGEVNTRFAYSGEQLEDTTVQFQKFAEITGTDSVRAVQMVSRAMEGAGIDSSEYSSILDDLALAAQASGVSVDKMAEGLTKYGAPMRALGFDTEETIAVFAQWEKAGINTETAFAGMQKAVQNWSADGRDAKAEFRSIVDEIANAPDITKATEIAMENFGKKAGPELADAIQSGRFEYSEFLDLLENSDGTVNNTYEATQDGFDKIKLAVQGLKADTGEMLSSLLEEYAPEIEKGTEKIKKALSKGFEIFTEKILPEIQTGFNWIIRNLPLIKAGIAGTAAAFAAFKAVTFIQSAVSAFQLLASVIQAVGVKQAALNFIMSMNPIGIIIAAVAGLVAAFVVLWNKSEAFRDFWTGLWESVQETLYGFFEAWETGWNAVTDFVKSLWDGFIEAISDGWKMIADFFVKAGNSIKNTAVGIWTEIKNVWNSIPGWFSEKIITPVGNFFTGMWDSLKSGAKEAWEGIKSVFGTVADWFGEKFRTAWEKVKAVFSTGGKIFDGIKEGITNAFKTVVNAVIRGINKVVSIPFNAINSTLDKLRSVSIAGAEPFKNLISRFDVPQIPELARGGILKKGQIGLLEGNGAEAVLPLEKNTEGLKKIARLIADYIIPLEIPKPDIPEIGGKWLDEAADRISSGINAKSRTVHQTVHNSTVNNFNQTNNSPKSLSRLEIYRQSKNLLRMKG